MKKVAFGLLVVALSASPVWAAGLKLTIGDGHVSLDAQDVTIRQILAEWARLGKTRIVNLEGVTSGPMTLKLDNVPESVALDIILRAVPGYMAAPRSVYLANASVYDRILLMTTASSVANVRSAPVQGFQQPNVTQLRSPGPLLPGMLPEPGDNWDDPAMAAAAAAGLLPLQAPSPAATMLTPGMPAPFPDQNPPQPTPAASPSNPWNVPTGASLPGLATPPPQPPAMPAQNVRRPPQADR
jgi:hypothetical protein